MPLYTNLGSHHKTISTKVPATQRYFDQGLRLVYGFNHAEAIRAFQRAAELDPTCAMCYWGIALAYGPHVNAAMDSASGVAAYAAVQRARSLMSNATPPERAYIEAVAQRYAAEPPADRTPLDTAYSRAMSNLASTYPDDLDAATLYAESLMDLRPWNYWRPDGTPYPGTDEIVRQLGKSSPATRTTPARATTTSTPSRRWTRRPRCRAPSASRGSCRAKDTSSTCPRTSTSASDAGTTP